MRHIAHQRVPRPTTMRRRQLAAAVLLLLAVLVQQPHPAVAEGAALDEGPVMRRLRQAANDAGLVKKDEAKDSGWRLDDPTHHCNWSRVACANGRVTEIKWSQRTIVDGSQEPAPERDTKPTAFLLPELAQLHYLTTLDLQAELNEPGLPDEWLHSGAFPRLQNLLLAIATVSVPEPLPPIEPGALPRLKRFNLMLEWQEQPVPLPPSWGTPGVWPLLRELVLVTPVQLPLPASWGRGFPSLRQLAVNGALSKEHGPLELAKGGAAAAGASKQAPQPLPAEWAGGFPNLETLMLAGLGLGGTFPVALQAKGSFPRLRKLSLDLNQLSGRLPAALLCNLRSVKVLMLGSNNLTGPLPEQWGRCPNRLEELLLSVNQLTGPAFPPAWVAPNSTLNLSILSLAANPGLEGTLPPSLNWPKLHSIYAQGTQVHGSVPEQWCAAVFAGNVRIMLTDAAVDLALSNSMPSCAKRDMPNLVAWADDMRALALAGTDGAGKPGWLHGRSGGQLLLLLALLAVGAAVAAASVNRRRRRGTAGGDPAGQRQRRLHSGDTARPEEIELLWPQPEGLEGGEMRCRRPSLTGELVPGRDRLKAKAQRQLGGTALLSGQSEEELMSLLRGRLEHTLTPSLGSARVPVQLLQGWGLPTNSLRIEAAHLQFVAEKDGSLVQLGEGAHGVVFLAKLQGTYVAAKVFEVQPGMDTIHFWQEVELLKRCMHPRIVAVHGVAVHGDLLMVAMQLMLGGSLRAALLHPETREVLRWSTQGWRVALDIAEAVAYLHEEAHILHSDIKSANVLLSLDGRAALTDLGVAQVMESTARTAVGGSNLYAAPEQLLGERCTLAADIYSLGMLLAELTTGHVIVKRGQWELPRPPDDCPQDVADLIAQCVSSDPRQRPTAAEVLRRLRASGSSEDGG